MTDVILFQQVWLLLLYVLTLLLLIFSLTKGKTLVLPLVSCLLFAVVIIFEFLFSATLQEILVLSLIVMVFLLSIGLRELRQHEL